MGSQRASSVSRGRPLRAGAKHPGRVPAVQPATPHVAYPRFRRPRGRVREPALGRLRVPSFDADRLAQDRGELEQRPLRGGRGRTGRHPLSFPPEACGSGLGLAPAFWKTEGGNDYFVCRWTQFAGLAEPLADGWYHGAPWWGGRNGAPRDSYLRLDTIDYSALLNRYRPYLKYASQETYLADSINTITDNYTGTALADSNKLYRPEDNPPVPEGTIAAANPSLAGVPALNRNFLGPQYPAGVAYPADRQASVEDRLDERNGAYQEDADRMRQAPGNANKVYARAVYDTGGRLWLQYWLSYYYDDQDILGFGVHEADWEMVQYGLNDQLAPELATYSRHGTEDTGRCPWSGVERIQPEDAPVVYVADGGHGNYFSAGTYDRALTPDDVADGGSPASTRPSIDEVLGDQGPSWAYWPGRWGGSGAVVRSPGRQGVKWESPGALNDGAELGPDCPEYAGLSGARAMPRTGGGRRQLRAARTPASGLRLTALRRTPSSVQISYRAAPRVRGIQVTIASRDKRRLQSGRNIRMGRRQGGHLARIPLPKGRGPYTLRITSVYRGGAIGRMLTRTVK